jgi:hypothetical protein
VSNMVDGCIFERNVLLKHFYMFYKKAFILKRSFILKRNPEIPLQFLG